MRVRSVVLSSIVVATLLTGCEKSPRDKLQGKWVGETVGQVHPSQQARAEGWARGTQLEFSGNKVTISVPAESPRTGTFKIAKQEGKNLELVFKRPGGGDDKAELALAENDKLVWTLGGGVQLVMRRVN
ncbi:MAG: hypothetical protein JNL21_06900 [Myxococcales bacterium]|nr:hypothetical protein [Myxococcales bacterium]